MGLHETKKHPHSKENNIYETTYIMEENICELLFWQRVNSQIM